MLWSLSQLLQSPSSQIRQATADALFLLTDRANMAPEDLFWSNVLVPFIDGVEEQQTGTSQKPAIIENIIATWAACRGSPGEEVQARSPTGESVSFTCLTEENYKLAITLAKIVGVFGERHMCNKKCTGRPAKIERFLVFCLEMLQHPSPTICMNIVGFWYEFFRHEVYSKWTETKALVPHILPILLDKLLYPNYTILTQSLSTIWTLISMTRQTLIQC
ncbi:hypothetical protein BC829DRAFT_74884 [Chytridium lagenaria]|nr:hypothetical protein BC829DRAFT_74884 [Chytridium lagenaria]